QVRADLNAVGLLQQALLDALAVYERAVQAALVLDHDAHRLAAPRGVPRGHRRPGQHHVVGLVPADLGDAAGQRICLLVAQPRAPHQLGLLAGCGQRHLVGLRGGIDDSGVADLVVVCAHGSSDRWRTETTLAAGSDGGLAVRRGCFTLDPWKVSTPPWRTRRPSSTGGSRSCGRAPGAWTTASRPRRRSSPPRASAANSRT